MSKRGSDWEATVRHLLEVFPPAPYSPRQLSERMRPVQEKGSGYAWPFGVGGETEVAALEVPPAPTPARRLKSG